jgi:hypothetical protein
MKFAKALLVSTMFISTATAFAGGFGEGYYNGLRDSRTGQGQSAEWVYLNQPSDYQGPGRLAECQKVSTYQGGPKNGMWRTYFVCRVAN